MPSIAVNGNGVNTTLWTPNPAIISKTGVVRINNQPIVVDGDVIPTHTRSNNPTHTSPTMVSSQSAVRVNGSNVIIDGDRASCDATHVVSASSGNVNIS